MAVRQTTVQLSQFKEYTEGVGNEKIFKEQAEDVSIVSVNGSGIYCKIETASGNPIIVAIADMQEALRKLSAASDKSS